MKPHAIVTCCDAKYGDFLLHHWLRSLRDHVNLDRIDVVVLDYGLTAGQAEQLRAHGVILHPSKKDGNLTNIRYRDLVDFLKGKPYDQVLSIDGGDIIFQADISSMFERDKESFRAVREYFTGGMHVALLGVDDVRPEFRDEIKSFLWNRSAVNGGVVFAPAWRFVEFYAELTRLCHSFSQYATDQLLISFFLEKTGFVPLDDRYNFALMMTHTRYRVRRGVFLGPDGQPIPVVHNTGNKDWIRTVRNFGYGPDRNQVKWLLPAYMRLSRALLRRWNRLWGPTQTGGG